MAESQPKRSAKVADLPIFNKMHVKFSLNSQLSESWHYRKINWVSHARIMKRPTFDRLELSESLEAALKGVEGRFQLSESWHFRKFKWVSHARIMKNAALDR